MKCPSCKLDGMLRSTRRGFLEIVVYPMMGYYPWTCGACCRRYLMKAREKEKG